MDRPVRLADIMKPKHNSFGVIRLAMALAVLVSHSYYFVSGDPATEPLYRWTGHSLGEHAVQVFFFLSGILVTESLLRSPGVLEFATARALRIFPGLLVCIVLTVFLLGPIVSAKQPAAYFGDPDLPRYLLKTALLVTGAAPLPGVFENLPAAGLFNMSLWTLKYEVICYVGLALLGASGLLRKPGWRYSVAALTATALLIVLPTPSASGTYTLLEHIRYFALYFGVGMLASLLKEHVWISARLTAALFVLFLLSLGTNWVELACVLFIGAATLLVSTLKLGPLRHWTNRHDLSFGVYIYAAPLQQAALLAAPSLGPLGLSFAVLLPIGVLAAASWTYIEKPAMDQRHAVGQVIAAVSRSLAHLATRYVPGARRPQQSLAPSRLALAIRRRVSAA